MTSKFKAPLCAAVLALAAAAAMLPAPAMAGEGHWSIGNGVQCKIVLGVVVCSKSRP